MMRETECRPDAMQDLFAPRRGIVRIRLSINHHGTRQGGPPGALLNFNAGEGGRL